MAKEACPNIEVLYVSADEVTELRKQLEKLWADEEPQPIPDIRSAHYFKCFSESELQMSVTSPFLPELQEDIQYTKASIFKKMNQLKVPTSGRQTTDDQGDSLSASAGRPTIMQLIL